MQQYYGICLDDVKAGTVGVRHAAALASHLPLGSRTLARYNERLSFTNTDWLLLALLNSWHEEAIDPFSDKSNNMGGVALPIDELEAILSKSREVA